MKIVKTFESFTADNYRDMEMDYHDKMSMEPENYMFFGDLMTIKRCVDQLLQMDPMEVDQILKNGHDWAEDHIATSKDDIEEVYNFLMNEMGMSESFVNEADVLDASGLAKRLYNKLKRDGHDVTLNYQNQAMSARGKSKHLGDGRMSVNYYVDHVFILGANDDAAAQELKDKYSTPEMPGRVEYFAWSDGKPVVSFSLNQPERRSTYNVNTYSYSPAQNKNDRRRLAKVKDEVEMSEGSHYSCNECGAMYEAHECNEDMTCEGCGGNLSEWKANESSHYSCNECGNMYEAHECNEDMTCEGCGCKLTPSYE